MRRDPRASDAPYNGGGCSRAECGAAQHHALPPCSGIHRKTMRGGKSQSRSTAEAPGFPSQTRTAVKARGRRCGAYRQVPGSASRSPAKRRWRRAAYPSAPVRRSASGSHCLKNHRESAGRTWLKYRRSPSRRSCGRCEAHSCCRKCRPLLLRHTICR